MVELIWNDIKISWVNLYEGMSGDYDEDDPNDVNYLRFDVMKLVEPSVKAICTEDFEWEQVEGASYCTQVPATVSEEELTELALIIMVNVYDTVSEGLGIKSVCEELSWMDETWATRLEEKV